MWNKLLISMWKILQRIILLCWLVYIYSREGMIRRRSYFRMDMSPRPYILIEAAFPPTVNCPNLHQIRLNCFKLLYACMTYVLYIPSPSSKILRTCTGRIGRSKPVVSRSKNTTVGPLRCLLCWCCFPPRWPDIARAGYLFQQVEHSQQQLP